MKNTLTILLLFAVALCFGQKIKINAGTDSVLNCKQKAILTGFSINEQGSVGHISYILRKVSNDGNTELNNTFGSDPKKRLYADVEYVFQTGGVWINTTTKVILSDTTGVSPKARLQDYLKIKAINSYPGVANADPLWELIEGVFKEVIQIRQNSGQLQQ